MSPTLAEMAGQYLTHAHLDRIIAEVTEYWAANVDVDPILLASLENIDWQIADLPGRTLGEVIGNTVFLDFDAAGFGWFVDQEGAAGFGQIDLLTVAAHELGHVLGYRHNEGGYAAGGSLMGATLDSGVSLVAVADIGAQLHDTDSIVAQLEPTVEESIKPSASSVLVAPAIATATAAKSTATVSTPAKPAATTSVGDLRVFDPGSGELLTYAAEARGVEVDTDAAVERVAATAEADNGKGFGIAGAPGYVMVEADERDRVAAGESVDDVSRTVATAKFAYYDEHGEVAATSADVGVAPERIVGTRPEITTPRGPDDGSGPAPASGNAVIFDLEEAVVSVDAAANDKRDADALQEDDRSAKLASAGALGAVWRLLERSRGIVPSNATLRAPGSRGSDDD